MEPQEVTARPSLFERFGALKFTGFVFLIPLFVVPALSVPFQAGKSALVFLAVVLYMAWFVVDRLKAGKVSIPWTPVVALAFLLPLVSLLSSFFAASPLRSIVGSGFELDTVFSMLSFALVLFLVPQFFRTKQSIFNLYMAVIASFFVLFIFGLIRLVAGPDVFTLNILTSPVANLIGSWNDFGVYAGLIVTLSLVMLEIVPPKGILKAILIGALVCALGVLAVVNFDVVWYVVGLVALALFLYSFTFAKAFGGDSRTPVSWMDIRRLPKIPMSVLLVAIIFILTSGQFLGASYPKLNFGANIAQGLNINQLEARPNLATTFDIASHTLKTSPLFGAGPNQFVYEWQKYRPAVVNMSAFWNVDFNFGIGVILSSLVSLGLLGGLAWVLFLGFFVLLGMKTLRRPREDIYTYYLSVTAFVAALYLWIMAILYTVSVVPFVLAFIMTGVFVASLVVGGVVRERIFSFDSEPSTRFITLLASIVLVVGLAAVLVFTGMRIVAATYFNNALITYNTSGDLAGAELKVRKAIALSGQDVYYRGLSEIALVNLNRVASLVTPQTPPEQVRNQLQLLLGGAIASAQSARDANSADYQNWMSLARTYESVVPLKIAGAYENAKASYDEAVKRNPTSPLVRLSIARLDTMNGDNSGAKTEIGSALALKSNYTDAIFLLAQIQVAEGNLKDAIASVESAAVISPNDATIFFQLGFLYYNNKDYQRASLALERAVQLEPSYANARYFLGLSYDQLGKRSDAITQFEQIEKTNPGNQEVQFILSNLRAGKSAFTSVKPPLDSKPEKRKTPPISDGEKAPDGI